MDGSSLYGPISSKTMCWYLDISKNTLNYWIKNCIPKEWKFQKIYTADFPNGRYAFTNEDYHIFQICKNLKQTMTAIEVREKLGVFIKKKIDNGEWKERK